LIFNIDMFDGEIKISQGSENTQDSGLEGNGIRNCKIRFLMVNLVKCRYFGRERFL
jgi:hypothetical protein